MFQEVRLHIARMYLVGGLLAGISFTHAASIDFSVVPRNLFPSSNGEVFSGAWSDFDGDGRPDLFLCGLSDGPGELLHNTANGFVRVAGGALATDSVPRAGSAWGDVNNDGRPDLLVAGAYGRQDVLYLNRDGVAFDRVVPAGIADGQGISVVWSDIDRDGWLDAYVVNGGGAASEVGFLLRNSGNGTLTRVLTGELATYAQYSHAAAFGDYDGDGDDDLIVTAAWNQPNALFRNDGAGNFTRTTSGEVGTAAGGGGATPAWGDFDNDGDLDLVIVNASAESILFRNDGGELRRHTTSNLANLQGDPVGAVWADLDNDGLLDIVLARRTASPALYRGLGNGRFEGITTGPMAGQGAVANGLAVADYDLDGDLDVWCSNWGSASPDTTLYRNDTRAGNHLRVRLRGVRSNRNGIGAKVRVRTVVEGREVWQLRAVGGFDGLAGQETIAHFGLGAATEADRVRVEWPSGVVQELTRVAANQVLLVEEATTGPLGIVPAGGSFDGAVQVTMYATLPAVEIRYTSDGTEPTATSTLYRGAITVTGATTIKARLYVNGFPVSEVQSAVFTPLAPLRFTPAGGLFTNAVEVSMATSIAGAEIRFTTDGSAPALNSERYTAALRLTATTTVQARSFINGFPVTETVSGTYRRVYAFDHEGIPAEWRTRYFGPDYATDPRAAAEADPDGDRSNNRQEFAGGTDPLDPLSGFRLGVRAVPEIRFASVPGRTYRILRLPSVGGGESKVVAQLVATGTETTWVDLEAGVVIDPAFYVVQPTTSP